MSVLEIDAIVFDFDGVLAESVSVKGEAFAMLYEPDGPEIQKKVMDHHLQYGGVSRFDKFKLYEEEFCGRKADKVRIDVLSKAFSEIVEKKVIESAWVTGARDFLEQFHNQVPLYVASATPEAELKRIIEQRGMTGYFKGIYGSPTQKGDNLAKIIEENGYDPLRVVMIGDTGSDMKAAEQNNMPFLGRKNEEGTTEFPESVTVMADLTELASLIKVAA